MTGEYVGLSLGHPHPCKYRPVGMFLNAAVPIRLNGQQCLSLHPCSVACHYFSTPPPPLYFSCLNCLLWLCALDPSSILPLQSFYRFLTPSLICCPSFPSSTLFQSFWRSHFIPPGRDVWSIQVDCHHVVTATVHSLWSVWSDCCVSWWDVELEGHVTGGFECNQFIHWLHAIATTLIH